MAKQPAAGRVPATFQAVPYQGIDRDDVQWEIQTKDKSGQVVDEMLGWDEDAKSFAQQLRQNYPGIKNTTPDPEIRAVLEGVDAYSIGTKQMLSTKVWTITKYEKEGESLGTSSLSERAMMNTVRDLEDKFPAVRNVTQDPQIRKEFDELRNVYMEKPAGLAAGQNQERAPVDLKTVAYDVMVHTTMNDQAWSLTQYNKNGEQVAKDGLGDKTILDAISKLQQDHPEAKDITADRAVAEQLQTLRDRSGDQSREREGKEPKQGVEVLSEGRPGRGEVVSVEAAQRFNTADRLRSMPTVESWRDGSSDLGHGAIVYDSETNSVKVLERSWDDPSRTAVYDGGTFYIDKGALDSPAAQRALESAERYARGELARIAELDGSERDMVGRDFNRGAIQPAEQHPELMINRYQTPAQQVEVLAKALERYGGAHGQDTARAIRNVGQFHDESPNAAKASALAAQATRDFQRAESEKPGSTRGLHETWNTDGNPVYVRNISEAIINQGIRASRDPEYAAMTGADREAAAAARRTLRDVGPAQSVLQTSDRDVRKVTSNVEEARTMAATGQSRGGSQVRSGNSAEAELQDFRSRLGRGSAQVDSITQRDLANIQTQLYSGADGRRPASEPGKDGAQSQITRDAQPPAAEMDRGRSEPEISR